MSENNTNENLRKLGVNLIQEALQQTQGSQQHHTLPKQRAWHRVPWC